MTKIIETLTLLILMNFICWNSIASEKINDETKAVEKTVFDSYINGVHILRDSTRITAGFHPEFKMLLLVDKKLEFLTLDSWIEKINKIKVTDKSERKVEWKFPIIDVTNTAAVVKVELYINSVHIYTDYLLLYKFEEGWRIVSKVFYKHN